jgi:parvulin-like peptidyl-prolyl isomerase
VNLRVWWMVALLLACGPAAEDAWVARVDGDEVSLAELRQAVEPRLADTPDADHDVVRAEELERLVVSRLILNRAHELGVEVTDAEVDGRLQLVHGTEFEPPDPGYRARVRDQMTLERAAYLDLAEASRPPEHAVLERFEINRDRYRQPPRVQIRQIVVEDGEKAEKLRAAIDAGEEFASVARANSLAPEAKAGGLLPPFGEGEMPEAFDPAFALKPGQLSPVIESPYGFHIFLLVERTPGRDVELGEVREEIALELQRERLDELRREWLRGLRRGAEIEVNERLLEQVR